MTDQTLLFPFINNLKTISFEYRATSKLAPFLAVRQVLVNRALFARNTELNATHGVQSRMCKMYTK